MYGLVGKQTDKSSVDKTEDDRQNFLLLLLMMLPLQVIYPVLSGGQTGQVSLTLFFSLILITGLWLMRGSRRRFLIAAILVLISLELIWVSLWQAATSLLPLGEFCLLLFLIILSGRYLAIFIRTKLPVHELLLAATALFLLIGTILGISLYLISTLYHGSTTGVRVDIDLPQALFEGIAILTANGSGGVAGESMPLLRVVSSLGMIVGILFIALLIAKIVTNLYKYEKKES
ncbi:hypothetical protein [Methanospirillum lacunae]|uniref:Potassium channel domain-containing protein n=1 Tax=Methanospirillum lacunae TaxID=668570 RepID=A0A2V2MWH2_9EURY|nr:hypothetical protein [Methanospirillum lacunae]PWR70605.1 hypothetical protein DK846_14535 [Methanospirillum lacunae]